MATLRPPIAIGRQHGAVAVELAIALPLLLFMLLVSAEFGRMFWQFTTLTYAVRDATRYLAGKALLGSSGVVVISAQLETETKNLVLYGTTSAGGTAVVPGLAIGNVTVANAGAGNVSIAVVYPYTGVFGNTIPNLGFGSESTVINLNAQSVMKAI